MQFTRNWGFEGLPIEKGSPGGAVAPTGGNRKKNTFNIADFQEDVKPAGPEPIYGATVYWTGADEIIRSGTVIGEYCGCIALNAFFYKVKMKTGRVKWLAGKDLSRTRDEATRLEARRKIWRS